MTPEDIKNLRAQLRCTARELADALGVQQKDVLAWEAGELFPTKRLCEMMAALREKGPSAVPRKAKGASPPVWKVLADPTLWDVFRKVLAHKRLRDEVVQLAASYPDPAED